MCRQDADAQQMELGGKSFPIVFTHFRPTSSLTRTDDCEGLQSDPSATSSNSSNLPPHHCQNCLPQMQTLLTTLQHLALTLKTEPSWSASPPRFTPHSCSGKATAGGPVTAQQSGPPSFTPLVLKILSLLSHPWV